MKNCDLVEKNTNIYITTEREQATHINSSNSVEESKKHKKKKKKIAIGFFLHNIILLSNNKCYNKADKKQLNTH